MYVLRKLLFIIVPIVVMALAGCGGGGGSSNVTGQLTLTTTPPDSSGQHGTATAVYTPINGKSPQGVVIDFSTNRPDIIALDSTSQTVGSDGTAPITFRAVTIANTTIVEIYATTGGLKAAQQVTITGTSGGTPTTPVTPPPPVSSTPNSISFNAAQPQNITLKGMGGAGLVETSIVSFIVKDTANQPLSGVTVDFSLNTTVGGLTLTPASGISNASGIVQTIVSSGTIATPVKVTATVRGSSPVISVQSDQLVVSTGLPAQDSFSISLSNLNPEAWNIDGTSVDVTARVADHFHNPVPDGTAIYFTTSGGSIQPSCTTKGGVCTVKWNSQNPRPLSPLGRATIFAYAVGEESFIDSNGNGVADNGTCMPITVPGVGQAQQCGEFVDIPEAYRDDNMNGTRDLNPLTGQLETFIDFNGDGLFNGLDGLYEGLLRPASVAASVPKTKHVFYNSQIVMSTSSADIAWTPATVTGTTTVDVTVKDTNGNTMPSGTKIDITTSTGTLSGITSFVVPQNVGTGATYSFGIAKGTAGTSGFITIKVTSPSGLITYGLIPANW